MEEARQFRRGPDLRGHLSDALQRRDVGGSRGDRDDATVERDRCREATGGADFDLARYGMEVFRNSPRQADLMIVAGRVSQKMAPVLRQVYDQMMEPKWVISMGVCASTGGLFNNYAIVQGVDQIVPVDVYAPGCPPSPETLMHAILTLHEQIRTGEIMKRRHEGRPVHLDGSQDLWTPEVPVAVRVGTPK